MKHLFLIMFGLLLGQQGVYAQDEITLDSLVDILFNRDIAVHNLNDVSRTQSYVLYNEATDTYLKGGGRWDTHLAVGSVGVPMNVFKNGEKYKLCTGINGGYINAGGYIEGPIDSYTDMILTPVEDSKFTITAANNKLLQINEETKLANFNGTDSSNELSHWKFIDNSLLTDVRKAEFHRATINKPLDATFLIPGAYCGNLVYGIHWNMENPTGSWAGGISQEDATGIYEFYRSPYRGSDWENGFLFWQDIKLQPGVYSLRVQGFYRDGDETLSAIAYNNGTETIGAFLFADSSEIPLKSIFSEKRTEQSRGWALETGAGFIPNTMTEAAYTFLDGGYENELIFSVKEEKLVTLGIRGDESSSFGNWTAFNNFRLTYYGRTEVQPNESYYIMNVETGQYLNCGNQWDTHAMLKEQGKAFYVSNSDISGKYRLNSGLLNTQYGEGFLGLEGFVDNYVDIDLDILPIENGIFNICAIDGSVLNCNSSNKNGNVNFDNSCKRTDPMAQWIFVPEAVVRMEKVIAMQDATLDNPIDVTFLMSDPDFDVRNSRMDLMGYQPDNINVNLGADSEDAESIIELYRADFNECTGEYALGEYIYLKPGMYKVNAQGFYRDGDYAYAEKSFQDGTECLDAFLCVGDINDEWLSFSDSVAIRSIFSDAREDEVKGWRTWTPSGCIPNTMVEASYTFQAGAYDNELTFYVTKDGGEYKWIGFMAHESNHYNNWLALDNYRISYYGKIFPTDLPHLVTYILDGEVIYTLELKEGEPIPEIEVSEREGYAFSGWDLPQTHMGTDDIVIEGHYTLNTYKIIYYVGFDIWATDELTYGSPVVLRTECELDNPNYTFMEWVGERYETMPAHDIYYYARFADSVVGLSIDDTKMVNIYTIDGRLVHSNVVVKDIQKVISAGVYIINGQKIIVK